MNSRALPQPLQVVNEGLAFLIELMMLGALAWWGAESGGSVAGQILPGCGRARCCRRPVGTVRRCEGADPAADGRVLAVKALVNTAIAGGRP